MPESIYDRSQIIAEVQNRFATKQKEVGNNARQTDVVMAYFTGDLGSEPIARLLKNVQEDPSAVAMDMQTAFKKLRDPERVEYVKALGYGIAGVLGYRLPRTAFEPWTTEGFLKDSYDLFFSKAHLDRPVINPADESHRDELETILLGQDVLTSRAVRQMVLPEVGQPGKIGDFFRSIGDLRRIPSVAVLIENWVHPSLTFRVLEAGQSFQAAVDAITPKTRPLVKNFLEGLDL